MMYNLINGWAEGVDALVKEVESSLEVEEVADEKDVAMEAEADVDEVVEVVEADENAEVEVDVEEEEVDVQGTVVVVHAPSLALNDVNSSLVDDGDVEDVGNNWVEEARLG
jgi:3-isopropylmalate dehydratase small subunit